MTIETSADPCKCRHERGEHFEGKHNCMRQCDCKAFRDPRTPDPIPPRERRPNHASWCRCSRCAPFHAAPKSVVEALDDDEEAPSTQRIPYYTPGWP